jgi:prepilin-type N-terminal cleavage/methylation domain-containing protein
VTRNEGGFTLVEVLMAVIVLGVGVTALVGSSAMVTRMVGRGKGETVAAEVANRRIEGLRALAYSSAPRCTAAGFVSGGPTPTSGGTEQWTVVVDASARYATVTETVRHRVARGTHTDVLTTRIEC